MANFERKISRSISWSCVSYFYLWSKKKQKAIKDKYRIPLSADWALPDDALADIADDDDDDDDPWWWWCESLNVECLPSTDVLGLSVDDPSLSLSFDFDFSLNFDDIRSRSACITDRWILSVRTRWY